VVAFQVTGRPLFFKKVKMWSELKWLRICSCDGWGNVLTNWAAVSFLIGLLLHGVNL
jgi:hypothetical protein